MHLYDPNHIENAFSLENTRLFVKYILDNDYSLEFFLNDTYKLDNKYVPSELHGIINCERVSIDEEHAMIKYSIFSLKKHVFLLLKLKIDIKNKIIQLFPIEIKYDQNEKNECSLIEELILENNIVITDPISILEKNVDFVNLNEAIENSFMPELDSFMDFIFFIWGADDEFWDKSKLFNIGISKWYERLSNYKSMVTINGILFNIPDSLILEYFESDGFDINYETLSESSKKCLEYINKSIRENKEFFSLGFVPKFTWSTPTDATWINSNRNICCKTLEELFILLKASTKVSEDIDRAKEGKISNVLLLREYIPTLDEMFEFRVFIGGRNPYSEYKILGISQKHICYYYKELSENFKLRTRIKSSIMEFFLYSKKELILELFDIFNSMCIAFDIYISNYKEKLSILIIDVQPLLHVSPLLFNLFELKLNLLTEEGTEFGYDILRTTENNSTKNMINNSSLKGFIPDDLLSVSNSDFYNNGTLDKLEWIDYK
ncbi:D123 family protein [Cryptosporidium meleagridis]|uniref:D123 family protein n=1 Tax=Cryptosporidium meleagridis TaxID=93969 RepID=A0A2P4YYS8_9CRYT|nr:D123 family protein [Cryptosporidium meleagridis]